MRGSDGQLPHLEGLTLGEVVVIGVVEEAGAEAPDDGLRVAMEHVEGCEATESGLGRHLRRGRSAL